MVRHIKRSELLLGKVAKNIPFREQCPLRPRAPPPLVDSFLVVAKTRILYIQGFFKSLAIFFQPLLQIRISLSILENEENKIFLSISRNRYNQVTNILSLLLVVLNMSYFSRQKRHSTLLKFRQVEHWVWRMSQSFKVRLGQLI